MSNESDRMLVLLQELAIMKKDSRNRSAGYRKRLKEIRAEMKELAAQKKEETIRPG